MDLFVELRSKIRNILNLFKPKEEVKLDKISDYYHNLSKKPPKINNKIR